MRKVRTLLGSFAALAILTAPALAKNSEIKPTEQSSASSQCHSLQPGPDGSWIEIPCQEVGSPAQPPARSAARSAEQTSH